MFTIWALRFNLHMPVRSVIGISNARDGRPWEIHQHTCKTYGQGSLFEGTVQTCVWMFNDGWQSVHDKLRAGTRSLVTKDSREGRKNHSGENRVVTISDLATRVPEVSKSLLHKIEALKIDGNDDLRSEVERWLKTETAHFYEEGLCRSLRHGMTNSWTPKWITSKGKLRYAGRVQSKIIKKYKAAYVFYIVLTFPARFGHTKR